MSAPADIRQPIDVLREVLAELGARKLSAAGYLGRRGEGFSVEFYWVAKGGPLILQLTADGGYDLYVPMLNTIEAEPTIRTLREYAAGFHGAVALHRQLAASVSFLAAPEGSEGVPATPEADRVSSDPPAAKPEGSGAQPACDYHAMLDGEGRVCGGGAVAVRLLVNVPGLRGETRHVCAAVAETWQLDGRCEILKEGEE